MAIITTLSSVAPIAGMKKWPRELSMPMKTAARQTSNMYGNTTLNSSSISRVCVSNSPHISAAERPSMTKPTTNAEATTSAETTALAVCHIALSPSVFSLFLNSGMNAAVSAPSPSRRRKRLGIWKA